MSDGELFFSLLRINAAQILRAAGLTTAKPSVLDAFTDILRRYLILLGTTTRDIAERNNRVEPELCDVRMALEHVGLVRPLNVFADPEDDDARGVEALVEWFRSAQAREMRRVAGFAVPDEAGGGGIGGGGGGGGSGPGEPAGGAANGVGMGGAGQAKNDEWLAVLRKLSEKRAGSGL